MNKTQEQRGAAVINILQTESIRSKDEIFSEATDQRLHLKVGFDLMCNVEQGWEK